MKMHIYYITYITLQKIKGMIISFSNDHNQETVEILITLK